MIDAHLAALAWYAAIIVAFFYSGFLAGMAHQAKNEERRREWAARRREREMRR